MNPLYLNPTYSSAKEEKVVAGLPVELWKEILSYINQTEDYKSISSCAVVSRFFRESCIEQCSRLRTKYIFDHFSVVESDRELLPFTQERYYLRWLAVGEDGKHYYGSTLAMRGCILFILDPAGQDQQFSLTRLDLVEEIHQKGKCELPAKEEIKRVFGEERILKDMQRIVSCHPTKNGFIVVTNGGASIWEYQEGIPHCIKFISPYEEEGKLCYAPSDFLGRYIQTSAYQNNTLILADQNSHEYLFMLDLKRLTFQKVVNGTGFFPLSFVGRGELFVGLRGEERHFQQTTIENRAGSDESGIPEKKKLVLSGTPLILQRGGTPEFIVETSGRWAFIDDGDFLCVIDHDRRIHIGPEMGIRSPERYTNCFFLIDDFLFIGYGKEALLRVIHIPSKTEYTDKFGPLLDPYLQMPETYLFAVALRRDVANEKISAEILFLQRSESIEKKFYRVEVPLVFSDALQEIQTPPEPAVPVSTPPEMQLFSASSSSPCSLTDGKIILLAGAALFFATVVVTTILMILHPGSVVYQGSGIILTLPAVLTFSVGGMSSLIVIAIGSYQWWKRQQGLEAP